MDWCVRPWALRLMPWGPPPQTACTALQRANPCCTPLPAAVQRLTGRAGGRACSNLLCAPPTRRLPPTVCWAAPNTPCCAQSSTARHARHPGTSAPLLPPTDAPNSPTHSPHPPCRGPDLRTSIQGLVALRQRHALHSESKLKILAADKDMYVACIDDK